jgi:hypothetical protein
MNTRRLIVYLILNAVVSAAATLSALWWWDRTHSGLPAASAGVPAAGLPTAAPLTPAASAAAPARPSEALPTPTLYIVKGGDTLGSIAQAYGLTVEAIMSANGLTDPNVVTVGQALVIPVPASAPPTAAPATSEVLATSVVEPPWPTATRDPSAPLPRLSIRDVRSPGKLNEEVLVIVNEGGPVDLDGWSVRDETGRLYVFPTLMLFQGGAVNIHTAAGSNSVTDLYWGLGQPVWSSGHSVLLSDAGGNLHARYTIP